MNNPVQEQEEGFIAVKLVPKQVNAQTETSSKKQRKFTAHYLQGSTPLKLQPFEARNHFDEFQVKIQESNNSSDNKKDSFAPSNPQHPYRTYTQNDSFNLVYSKHTEHPLNSDFRYIKRDIVLEGGDPTKAHLYKFLRPFEQKKQHPISESNSLEFESRFECGNLHCAYQRVNSRQYHLFIENDTNSYGYNQWFYFSISNIKPKQRYTFKIVNFKKQHSFFRFGYKPAIFFKRKYSQSSSSQFQGNGWYRDGQNIKYGQSNISVSQSFKFYSLTFDLQFEEEEEYICIAANLPYSYTKLITRLKDFKKNLNQSEFQIDCTLKSICQSFCGNDVPEVKITPNTEKKSAKKMIIILARQHPGETVSSYMMQGVLKNLQRTDCPFIEYILKNFVIVIFPMVNVDGVIYGNFRCDISGIDMNRRWKYPSQIFHPQIFHIKEVIMKYSKEYQLLSCIDLHGHSKNYGIFSYGCKIDPLKCRVLPYLMSKYSEQFLFSSSTFGINRYMHSTARANIFKRLRNENVLTIETSYFGYKSQSDSTKSTENASVNKTSNSQKKVNYFQPKNFIQNTHGLLKALKVFGDKQKSEYNKVQKQIQQRYQQEISLQQNDQNHNQQQQDAGSESDPQGDQIEFQTKLNSIIPKHFSNEAKSFVKQENAAKLGSFSIEEDENDMAISIRNSHRKDHRKMDTSESPDKVSKTSSPYKKKRPNDNLNSLRIKKDSSYNRNHSLSNNKVSKPKIYSFSVSKRNTIQHQPQEKSRKKIPTNEIQQKNSPFEETFNTSKNKVLASGRWQQTKRNLSFKETSYQPYIEKSSSKQLFRSKNSPKPYDDIFVCSKSEQMPPIQPVRPYEEQAPNDFFIKFEKFIPQNMRPRNKEKLNSIQASIYKDNQSEILSTLMQNKKEIQREKMRLEIQKCVNVAQRQGRIKAIGQQRKQKIIDFRKFKEQERLKAQLKNTNESFSRYMEPFHQ